MPYIIPNSISSAYLQFYLNSGISYAATVLPAISGHSGWNAQTLTWNTTNGYVSSQNGVTAPTGTEVINRQYYSFPATSFIAGSFREVLNPNLYRTVAESRGIVLKTAENTNDTQYFNSANASDNKPRVLVNYYANYTTSEGSSYSAIPNYGEDNTQNCFGYAIGERMDIDATPNGITLSSNIDTTFQGIKTFLDGMYGQGSAVKSSIYGDLNSGEYRIAVRTFTGGENMGLDTTIFSNDFHFWRQTSNSLWCHKKNRSTIAVELTDTDNPSDITAEGWYYATSGGTRYYYNSDTIVFTFSK